MSTATDLLQEPAARARSAAVTRRVARLSYLDTLKVILISLVIALHTAITYGAIGDWPFTEQVTDEIAPILLTLVTTTVQAFSLGLYFFISGYFTPGSYDRKGIGRFWKDRLLRIAVPMLVYTFLLSRITLYIALTGKGEQVGSFGAFFLRTFITDANEGPTWFLFALLLFSLGYTLWRLATQSISPEKLAWMKRLKTPGRREILGFGLVVAVLMFIVGLKSPINNTIEILGTYNLMVIFFVQYILAYIAGVLAYRNDWLAGFNGKDLRFWAWLSVGMFLTLPVVMVLGGAVEGKVDVFTGGLHWQAAAFMLWIGIFGVSISMALILWLRGKKTQGRVMAFAGPNSYAVYLIHPLVLVPLAVAFAVVPLHPLLKFVIVLPVVLVISFLLAEVLGRIPGVKAVLR